MVGLADKLANSFSQPKTRVLLVEDDQVFRSLVANFLTEHGYQVSVADDGEAGIKRCVDEQPDIVLCDILMPKKSGLEVLQTILEGCQNVPVIVISASEDMQHIREAVRLGAWDYLIKPIENLHLVDEAIHNCLDRHELEDVLARDVLELDHHLDVLYQDPAVVERLVGDLLPSGRLNVGAFELSFQIDEQEQERTLVDYRQLTDGKVLFVMAKASAVAGQTLIALLVLKTLINPLVRQVLAGVDDTALHPERILAHLNAELCHSKIRTAFDVVVGVIDSHSGTLRWTQSGSRVQASVACKPDLSLGIWQQASFNAHTFTFNLAATQFKAVSDHSSLTLRYRGSR